MKLCQPPRLIRAAFKTIQDTFLGGAGGEGCAPLPLAMKESPSVFALRYGIRWATAMAQPVLIVGKALTELDCWVNAIVDSAGVCFHTEALQDGAPEMWNLMRTAMEAAGVRRWHEGVDRYHLNERLGEALRIAEPDAAKRKQKLGRWNDQLDKDDGAIDRIAAWLSREVEMHEGDDRKTLEDHWTYLHNNNDRMRYASLRRVGLPSGSGATEGACKSVVMIRAKGCGQRWHEEGVGAALTLRAVYMSERLPTLWPHFAAQYSSDVKAAA